MRWFMHSYRGGCRAGRARRRRQTAEHPLHHGRRPCRPRHQRLRQQDQQDAEHRPHRQGGHALRRTASCTNSICTPSRACHPDRQVRHINGVPVFNRFDGSQPTLAKYLQEAGYHTGMIGKWHLGSDPTGFDYWNILPGQGVYHDPVFIDRWAREEITRATCTDIITDLSIDFLEKRPKDKPFFLMCHHKAPHRPWEPDDKHAKMYDDVEIPEPETFHDDYATRTDAAREATMRIDQRPDARRPQGEAARGLVGRGAEEVEVPAVHPRLSRLRRLDRRQRRPAAGLPRQERPGENTIVIYTSRPGLLPRRPRLVRQALHVRGIAAHAVPGPLAGRRSSPARSSDAHGPERRFRADAAGRRRREGARRHAGPQLPAAAEGRAARPTGARPCTTATTTIRCDHRVQPHYGVRTERYKLIYFNKINQWELYDLEKDPHEMKNLYADPAQADTVKKLKEEMYRLKKELKDDDQFADKLPPGDVNGQPKKKK